MNRIKECFAIRMNDIIAIVSIDHFESLSKFAYKPSRMKTSHFGFRTAPTQTGLYKHKWLEAGNFGFKK